ncbi:MAG: hypothetical protein NC095_10210 [Muribaculum sp.]|nr:hypothetical protein [Muribaculum sp.]
MKKPNKKVTRLVIWSVTGSILSNSCINIAPDSQLSYIEQGPYDLGISAIPLNITYEQSDYFNYVCDLAQKLISDREFAKEVNANPIKYLQTRSEEFNATAINSDEALMRITRALADDEIAEAIEQQDIKLYVKLMYKKGLLDNTNNDYANILTINQKRQILESLGIQSISDDQILVVPFAAVIWLFYIAVAIVSFTCATYTAAIGVNVAAGITVIAGVAAAVEAKVSGFSHTELSQNFDIYILSADQKDLIMDSSKFAKTVNEIVEVYKELYKEEAKQLDSYKLKQTINLNLSKQPIISDNFDIFNKQ